MGSFWARFSDGDFRQEAQFGLDLASFWARFWFGGFGIWARFDLDLSSVLRTFEGCLGLVFLSFSRRGFLNCAVFGFLPCQTLSVARQHPSAMASLSVQVYIDDSSLLLPAASSNFSGATFWLGAFSQRGQHQGAPYRRLLMRCFSTSFQETNEPCVQPPVTTQFRGPISLNPFPTSPFFPCGRLNTVCTFFTCTFAKSVDSTPPFRRSPCVRTGSLSRLDMFETPMLSLVSVFLQVERFDLL